MTETAAPADIRIHQAHLAHLLACPVTGQTLRLLASDELAHLQTRMARHELQHGDGSHLELSLATGLITEDKSIVYPIQAGILCLLSELAIPLTDSARAQCQAALSATPSRSILQSVREFYNQIGWQQSESGVYVDAALAEDLRPTAQTYVHDCHLRLKRYLPASGTYLLDVASGPIQYPEYLTYSENYTLRVCVDISFRALQEARRKLPFERGLFILGDITALPFQANRLDGIVSLHTIYHVPAEQQARAFEELYRILKPGGKAAVVYTWGQHSPLMRLALFPVYRVRPAVQRLKGTHTAKTDTPELYFHPHSYAWFSQQPWTFKSTLACWRSISVEFTRAYARSVFGKPLLRLIYRLEDMFPAFFGRYGQYPVIVLNKPKTE